MADINFKCGSCGQSLDAEPGMAGQSLSCPACSQTVTVPKPRIVIRGKHPEKVQGEPTFPNPDAARAEVVLVDVKLTFNTVCSLTLKFFLASALIGIALAGAYWLITFLLRTLSGDWWK